MADKEKHLELGVMIQMLGGNEEDVKALQGAIGKVIAAIVLANDTLHLYFTDATGISFFDDGQSCCESRYMVCDDESEFDRFVGAQFAKAEIVAAPSIADEYGEHEVQFLNIVTSKGTLQCATHNEHNGYYGGFYMKVQAFNA